MGPASTIIDICGGHKNVADWLNVDVSRVFRWTYAKAKGGSDGYIPSQYYPTLLARAQVEGKALKPEHFFLQSDDAKASRQRVSTPVKHLKQKRFMARLAP